MGRKSESRIRVRYKETDQMGVVHHGNYLTWFEVGRTEFIREIGMSYRELEDLGLLLPVLEANCKYRKSAKYDDEIIVRTTVQEMKGATLTFGYEVVRAADNELLAEGFTMHVFTSQQLKPINVRRAMPEIYELLAR